MDKGTKSILKKKRIEKAIKNFDEQPEDSKDYKIFVPITDMKHFENLLSIGILKASERGGTLIVGVIIEVPAQTPLYAGKKRFLEKVKTLEEKMEKKIENEVNKDITLEEKVIFTHDYKSTVVETAKKKDVDLLLLEWLEEFTHSELLGSSIDWILHHAPCDIILFKDRGLSINKKKSILVPTPIVSDIGLTVDIVSSLAREKGDYIEFVRVVDPDATKEEIAKIEEFHESIKNRCKAESSSKILKGRNIVKNLLEESEKYDLILLSSSRKSLIKGFLFGTIPNEIADKSETSILMVQEKSSSKKDYLAKVNMFFRRIKRRLLEKIGKV